MRFIEKFYLANYLLVILGFFSLYISEFLFGPALLLPLAAIALAEYKKTRALFHAIPTAIYTTLTLAYFIYLFFYVFLGSEDLIAAVLYLTIFIQLVKILTPNTTS